MGPPWYLNKMTNNNNGNKKDIAFLTRDFRGAQSRYGNAIKINLHFYIKKINNNK
jgi:hypothetical protein